MNAHPDLDTKDSRTEFQRRIAFISWMKGLNRYKLSKLTGISPATLSYWARYTGIKPTNETLNKFCSALGISRSWLLGETGSCPPTSPEEMLP